ncbi:MAG: primary-amine oxidase [Acidobacteriota bacterium]|nr:primary-amine oxidase [Acidobacteriota bacterium]
MNADKRRKDVGCWILALFIWLTVVHAFALSQTTSLTHPLDPLSKEEIAAASKLLKESGKLPANARFQTIVLNEPPKAEVYAFKPGETFRREAFFVAYDRANNKTFDGVADIRNQRVVSVREVPGAQPSIMLDDVLMFQSIVRSDAEWQSAMRKRGITEFGKVQVEMWSAGNFGFPEEQGKRLFRGLSYLREDSKNPYARPIEGVIAVVDMNARKVLKVIDSGVVPVPSATADVDEKSVGQLREAPKPLQIVQPNGASFEIRGNEIRWQKWRFRYALHPREGLVLYTVGYEDGGKVRPILYRASLSEMVVPYGDPSAGWFIRNAFDEGEFAIGRLAVPQEAKTDVPDNATLLDAVFSSEGGGALDAKRTIAIYERDGGVSWKHVDYMTNQNQSRRARQLVIGIFVVVGNYDYGFNWIFNQDGTIEQEVLLTGVMATKGVSPDAQQKHDPYGHVVANGVAAPHHQHFFNYRLDFDVDGSANTVVEQNTETLPPGKDNPYANAFVMHETPLRREAEAQRSLNLATHRRWRVINPTAKNGLGQPTGYVLLTGENSVPLPGKTSAVRQRAGFMNSHLWVTAFEPSEQYAAGFYINQGKGGDGLAKWVNQNRELENRDVVLWYSFGVTHLPRPEDYPVMPVHKAGFKLMPVGFFTQNPALDLPKK